MPSTYGVWLVFATIILYMLRRLLMDIITIYFGHARGSGTNRGLERLRILNGNLRKTFCQLFEI